MYHVRSRNQHLPSVIRNSELIVKILGKSDNNPDHVDIRLGREIGDEGAGDVESMSRTPHHKLPSPDHEVHKLAGYDDNLADRFSLEQSGDSLIAAGCRLELLPIGVGRHDDAAT